MFRNIELGVIKLLFYFGSSIKIGRAFILRGKEEIQTELEGIMKTNDHDIQEYEVTNKDII